DPSAAAPLLAERSRIEGEMADAEAAGTPERVGELEGRLAGVEARLEGLQNRQSFLGRAGRFIEPIVEPLGWDWRIGSAVLASFPAREVVVATLGVIFDVGTEVEEGEGSNRLRSALREATWADTGRALFTVPVALS